MTDEAWITLAAVLLFVVEAIVAHIVRRRDGGSHV